MKQLTHDVLHELLDYEPQTGRFVWKVSRGRVSAGQEAGHAWTKRKSGKKYRHIIIFRKLHQAHRLAWFYMTGEWPANGVDHRDGDGLNNAWGNLRQATQAQNLANRGCQKNSTTGFKGVSARRGRFRAEIGVGGKSLYLGDFETPEEAHAAYVVAAEREYGEYARVA